MKILKIGHPRHLPAASFRVAEDQPWLAQHRVEFSRQKRLVQLIRLEKINELQLDIAPFLEHAAELGVLPGGDLLDALAGTVLAVNVVYADHQLERRLPRFSGFAGLRNQRGLRERRGSQCSPGQQQGQAR